MFLPYPTPVRKWIAILAVIVGIGSFAGRAAATDSTSSTPQGAVGFEPVTASALMPSAIPNCGGGNALASVGNGFACMTPAQGAPGINGTNGATGAKGATGAQGPAGPAGPAGASGSGGAGSASNPNNAAGVSAPNGIATKSGGMFYLAGVIKYGSAMNPIFEYDNLSGTASLYFVYMSGTGTWNNINGGYGYATDYNSVGLTAGDYNPNNTPYHW